MKGAALTDIYGPHAFQAVFRNDFDRILVLEADRDVRAMVRINTLSVVGRFEVDTIYNTAGSILANKSSISNIPWVSLLPKTKDSVLRSLCQ
jgi:hypothetical protein